MLITYWTTNIVLVQSHGTFSVDLLEIGDKSRVGRAVDFSQVVGQPDDYKPSGLYAEHRYSNNLRLIFVRSRNSRHKRNNLFPWIDRYNSLGCSRDLLAVYVRTIISAGRFSFYAIFSLAAGTLPRTLRNSYLVYKRQEITKKKKKTRQITSIGFHPPAPPFRR